MQKRLVEYSHNNSGGCDWLNAKDWKKLEKEGWKVFDFDNFKYTNKGGYDFGADGFPRKTKKTIKGHCAFKFFSSIEEAEEEFARITGQDVYAEGCSCCGKPHSFSFV